MGRCGGLDFKVRLSLGGSRGTYSGGQLVG